MPRQWTGKEDIKAITKMARSTSLKLLYILAIICLDKENNNTKEALQLALVNVLSCSSSNRIWSNDGLTTLASNTWKDVSSTRTLIAPVQCMPIWRQLKKNKTYSETSYCCSGNLQEEEQPVASLGYCGHLNLGVQ